MIRIQSNNTCHHRLYFVVSLIFLLFFLFHNGLYLYLDNTGMATGDASRHLIHLHDTWQRISSGRGLSLIGDPVTYNYPPLVYLATCPMIAVGGMNLITVMAGQWLFWVVLAVSVYLLTGRVSGGMGGFIGLMLVMGSPYLSKVGRDYALDMPVTALTALALLMLAKSDNFNRRGYSYGFFIICAMAVLAKPMAVLYLSGPFLWVAYMALFPRKKACKNPGAKAVLVKGLLLAGVLLWPFYGLHFSQVLHHGRLLLQVALERPVDGFFDTLWFISTTAWGVLIFVATGFGLLMISYRLIRKTPLPRDLGMISLGLLWGLLVMGLLPFRDYRYYLPFIPMAAVVASAGINAIKHRPLKLLITGIILYGTLSSFTWWIAPDLGFYRPFRAGVELLSHRPHSMAWSPPDPHRLIPREMEDIYDIMAPDRNALIVVSAPGKLNAIGTFNLVRGWRILEGGCPLIHTGPPGNPPPGKAENKFLDLYMKPADLPGQGENLVIIRLTREDDYDMLPPGVREDLINAGFSHRPDMMLNRGLVRGIDGSLLTMRVLRIPIR